MTLLSSSFSIRMMMTWEMRREDVLEVDDGGVVALEVTVVVATVTDFGEAR